jgi:hypothetical protein
MSFGDPKDMIFIERLIRDTIDYADNPGAAVAILQCASIELAKVIDVDFLTFCEHVGTGYTVTAPELHAILHQVIADWDKAHPDYGEPPKPKGSA